MIQALAIGEGAFCFQMCLQVPAVRKQWDDLTKRADSVSESELHAFLHKQIQVAASVLDSVGQETKSYVLRTTGLWTAFPA